MIITGVGGREKEFGIASKEVFKKKKFARKTDDMVSHFQDCSLLSGVSIRNRNDTRVETSYRHEIII